MFTFIRQIFNPKNKDLQKKLIFTFLALFIFKVGTTIIVPGIDQDALGTSSLGFLELLNVMGGGAMGNFSIFALGVMPYISASLVTQLLEMDIVPYFSDLAKQGQVGRNKLNQITRIFGIFLAFVQGYMYSFSYIKGGTVMDYMQFALILTAGTSLLLWIGDQITAKGFGNGISLIIMTGIIASMPSMFLSAWNGLVDTATITSLIIGLLKFLLYLLVYLGIIVGVIFVQSAERRVPVQYANKSNSSYGGSQNYIPFKLNTAGVIPVIFASALLSIPSIISGFVKNESFGAFVNDWIVYTSPTGFLMYILLIVIFSYFYTYMQIKPNEMADNLQKNGGYIAGIRPGDDTVKYISKVLNRITIVGAIFLAILAGIPVIFGMLSDLSSSVTIGGTGLLIVVGVALETYKQLDSELSTRNYKKGRRNRR
ncbi:MAG TPA: preprotein translocase subunit SecY [Tenericutes bacterium]|nr:preprotein translocase subunit SecY [Mycoplasmatota bacterium]